MANHADVPLETNIYRLTKLIPIELYRFEFQISPNRNDLRNKIIGKFVYINKAQLLNCSLLKGDILFTTRSVYSLHLKSTVYHDNQAYKVYVTCKPIADSTTWVRDNLLDLIVQFWKQHYRKCGKIFYDPLQPLDNLERENLTLVAGFIIYFDSHRLELKILPRAHGCIQEGSHFYLFNDINSLSRKDIDKFKRLDRAMNLSYVKTAVRKLLSTGLTRFGIDLQLKTVSACTLIPPPILPSDSEGSFYQVPQGSHKWALFCFDPRYVDAHFERFREIFSAQARKHGLDFDQCLSCRYLPLDSLEQIFNILDNLSKVGIKFALLWFSFAQPTVEFDTLFLSIKFKLKQMQIPSQIVITEELDHYFDSENGVNKIDTLLIKLNIKLGGQVNIIDPDYLERNQLEPSKTMLVGATISFKGIVQAKVASLVGSLDNHWSRYEAEVSVNHQNEIDKLESMLTSLVHKYNLANGYYPQNLIFIRHHFDTEVCQQELATIQRVMSQLEPSNRLVYIVATNCHNIRVDFVSDSDRTDNILITDQLEPITEDYFYLYDKHSSRPTRYTIYHNEVQLSSVHLRQLLFDLCHYTVRSFQVNRYPAPLEFAVRQSIKAGRQLDAKKVVFHDPPLTEDATQQLLQGFQRITC